MKIIIYRARSIAQYGESEVSLSVDLYYFFHFSIEVQKQIFLPIRIIRDIMGVCGATIRVCGTLWEVYGTPQGGSETL